MPESQGRTPPSAVAPLLFGSGFCALVYQIAWLRDFRLVFGASTAASAAVLAIFIGGLGAGGLLIGPRADRHANPLWLYARLEALVALSAMATPVLVGLVRQVYVSAGGSLSLGLGFGTVTRLALSALVLAVPTGLMGGTLPAVARAVATDDDAGRRSVALLYGVNTLGAVAGSFVATFFLLEIFGTHRTLWLASLVNLLIALAARNLARGHGRSAAGAPSSVAAEGAAPAAPAGFVLLSACLVGFAFFLMEMVWYRMLAPILGGTVFTFGLILTMALLGIGLGGTAYSLLRKERPASLGGFAATCLLEAASLAVPWALGDRLAILALVLRPLGDAAPFWGHVLSWSLVCAVVVLPASLCAGYQFPMLVALLGRGRTEVGRQVGLAYAWNTAGAIAGSLAGGFGLLPLLSAPGVWRFTGFTLAGLGLTAGILAWRAGSRRALAGAGLLAALVGSLLLATGPTAVWRHAGIGAGRARVASLAPNDLEDWLRYQRSIVQWEVDGVESSVALSATGSSLAFVINGKVDGNARGDASTAVMSGMLGAILHAHPTRALVIGLGTGETAGWLGVVPTIDRVDVVELEPRVLDVARDCASMNHDVLANPKVHIAIGDAREALLVSKQGYDVVFSEPSNPYRAGIASMYTREYYEAAAARLREGGLFLQWMQAYEVDATTLRRIYATLGSVFPAVETWQTNPADLLLVASRTPVVYDVPALRARLAQEPYRAATFVAWRVDDLEGFLSHYVARPSLARAIVARGESAPNTDDHNVVEFGFARSVGRAGAFNSNELLETAWLRGEDRPETTGGPVDWERMEDARVAFYPNREAAPRLHARFPAERRALASALSRDASGDARGALAAWRAVGREPRSPRELTLVATSLAETGDAAALPAIERLREREPVEADGILARLRARQGRVEEAVALLEGVFAGSRRDPWPTPSLTTAALNLAGELGTLHPEVAPRLLDAIARPLLVHAADQTRLVAVADLLDRDLRRSCAAVLAPLEPHFPWTRGWLTLRVRCYAALADPRLPRAADDLAAYARREPPRFSAGLVPEPSLPAPAPGPR